MTEYDYFWYGFVMGVFATLIVQLLHDMAVDK